jgi:transposase
MIDETEGVVVMEASPDELERVAKRLSEVGIQSAIISPEKGKGGS